MHRLSDTASNQPTAEYDPTTPAIRSYREIARILAERDGTAITQALVGRMCRAAEMKLASALLADPEVHARLRPSAARPIAPPCHVGYWYAKA
jgi:hypothetical protein